MEPIKDNMVLNKDPTLVFHEKLPLESSDAHSDDKVMAPELLHGGLSSKIELESKEKKNLEDGDVFSFQAGRQNIDFQMVSFLPSILTQRKALALSWSRILRSHHDVLVHAFIFTLLAFFFLLTSGEEKVSKFVYLLSMWRNRMGRLELLIQCNG